MKKKPIVLLGLPEPIEDCRSQRGAAVRAIRERTFKRAFPSQEARERYLVGQIEKSRREAAIKPRAKTA